MTQRERARQTSASRELLEINLNDRDCVSAEIGVIARATILAALDMIIMMPACEQHHAGIPC